MQTLSLDQLNRATLARQLLLDREEIGTVEALERIGGVQAQEKASPYIALWTRLADFDPADLTAAIQDRRAVRATMMRTTLHLVSTDDYIRMLPVIQEMLRGLWGQLRSRRPDLPDLSPLRQQLLALTSVPRSNAELRAFFAESGIGMPPEVWWRARLQEPLVHSPDGATWAFGPRPSLVAAGTWLPQMELGEVAGSLDHLVSRYLGAFGPASAADIAQWSGLMVRVLRPAIERLSLDRFTDDTGRTLYDLPGAPLPDPGTPAPPRLLPMWDSILLAHANRQRVLPEEYRRVVIAKNGDTLPTFLVNGRVAGLWWAEAEGAGTRVVLEPFHALSRANRQALEEEGERLAAFVGPREPAVYRRYRGTRARIHLVDGGTSRTGA